MSLGPGHGLNHRFGLLWIILLFGCVHYNAVYNARSLFTETDRLRRVGLDSLSAEAYGRVIEGAQRGLNADRQGRWAHDALLLIGQSRLRRRELTQARDAFRKLVESSADERARQVARMFQGAVAVEMGDPGKALGLLDSVSQIENRVLRAEGYLWRARAHVEMGPASEVWRNLDAARNADASFSAPGDLLRLQWGVRSADTAMVFQGLQALMANSDARFFGDSIRGLLEGVAEVWGPDTVVRLMSGAERADWSRSERDALILQRGRLAHRAGRTALAFDDAERVAGGVGETARDARVQLAKWRLRQVTQLAELRTIRALLLPAVESTAAREILNGIRRVEFLVDMALNGESQAYFAAAERAREVLHADALAGALFLAYANNDADSPWLGKALLAARDLSSVPQQHRQIELRLSRVPQSAYVRYARTGESGDALALLEERLQSALTDIFGRMETELRARRLLLLDSGTRESPPLT